MRKLLLFVGGIAVGLVVQMAIAQSQNSNIVRVNHVGIAVPDLDEAVTYYTEILGFPEAFRVTDDEGSVALVYVQVSQNTFVELQPVNETRPAGLNHFGVHVDDMEAVISMFRERGADVQDSRLSSTHAVLSNVIDLNGVRMELLELPPESVHAQASDRWR
jgi:catechol 2,3-dioxygenase-like lactoylglutathione lyase family enzyme